MTHKHKTKHKHQKPSKPVALAFMGVGLLILGGLALALLTRPSAAEVREETSGFEPATPQQVNFPAPEVGLTDIDGNLVNFSSYGGKVILVNNWAIWCPPCRAELPELQAYFYDHQNENFTIIGIEAGSDKEDVLYHVDLFQLHFPIWLDPKTEALQAFRNGSLPSSYVIDGNGIVRLAWTGPINQAMLEKYVTPLLKE